ncbi:MAG: HEPN domain-containing protein [Gammaproteobacteria bacterium]|nr:HEPN domain-containing protein [Gammaproteobacteria bacterium]
MDKTAVISGWLRAVEKLKASDLELQAGLYNASVSSAYFATFFAARTALLVHGVSSKTHSGIRHLFFEHLVKSGKMEREWASCLGRQEDARLGADYDFKRFSTAEDAREENETSHRFLDRIRQYLLTQGLTESELDSHA